MVMLEVVALHPHSSLVEVVTLDLLRVDNAGVIGAVVDW
jgi:hypothetical protein